MFSFHDYGYSLKELYFVTLLHIWNRNGTERNVRKFFIGIYLNKELEFFIEGMAELPFESLSKAAKDDVRERRRGWLAKLRDTTPEQAFLVEMTRAWTAMLESVEDSLGFLAATAVGKAADSQEAEELARARKNAQTAAAWIKRAGMAASEGTTAAVDIFGSKYMEDELTEEELKAYKTHKRRSEEAKRSGYPGGTGARRQGGVYFSGMVSIFIF